MTAAARRIARFATGLQPAELPGEVIESAKLHLVDALGVGLAASTVPLSAPWAEAAGRIGGSGPASVLGRTEGLSATAAALANGALIHSLEYDDTHLRSVVHGSAVAAPVALAAAEAAGAGGDRLLTGYVVAWEAMIRLGLAAPGAYQANGFQVSAVGGALGAAAAAASIAGLEEDRAVAALGIAGSQASGLMAFLDDGSTVKALHPGWAAHTGIVAAELARAGMTGPESIVDGRFGFLAAFARDPEAAGRLDGLLGNLGGAWHLPEVAFKLYPCCHYIHPFLEATEALAEGVPAEEIAAVTCHVPPPMAPLICEPWERRQKPASGYDGKWGLAYCLAALLTTGRVAVETFARPPDLDVIRVARRIDWRPMESHDFPARFEALVEIRLADGTTRGQRIACVRGAPDRPIDRAEVEAKFLDNAGRALAPGSAARLLETCMVLDEAGPGALTALLRSAGS